MAELLSDPGKNTHNTHLDRKVPGMLRVRVLGLRVASIVERTIELGTPPSLHTTRSRKEDQQSGLSTSLIQARAWLA